MISTRSFLKSCAQTAAGLLVPAYLMENTAFAGIRRRSVGVKRQQSQVVTPSGITCDLWQDFEFDTPVDAAAWKTALEANDHCATGAWTAYIPNLSISTSAEQTLSPKINSLTDSGTRGLARDLSNATASNLRYALGSSKSHISIGFWFKVTGTVGASKLLAYVIGANDICRIDYHYNKYILFSGGTGTSGTLTDNTWYWLTADIVRNGTCTLSVYNSAGTKQGGNSTVNGGDYAITTVILNNYNNDTVQSGVSIYWDDLVIDWTNTVYPILNA